MEVNWEAIVSLLFICGLASTSKSFGQTQNRYVDATPPTLEARVFAAGVVSISREEGSYEERPVFSPGFREIYFDVNSYKTKTFTSLSMRYENGHWTQPEPAFFAKYRGFQASITPDGDRLFFVAPKAEDEKRRGIWMVERKQGVWAKPVLLDSPINSMFGSVGFPCVTKSRTLYFGATAGPGGRNAVYRSKLENDAYRSIEKLDLLPPESEYITGDFYVSPDESYIVFYSNLPGNLGQGDLYVAFQKSDGSWTKPKNLGTAVNTPGYDFAPSISPDGKYLFFARDVGGGQGDIYWISAAIVNGLQ
jgi:hypothetical protein